MVEDTSTSDVSPAGECGGRDGHGEAALVLVESLIHGLVSRNVIDIRQAIEVVETALNTQSEISAERSAALAVEPEPVALLKAMSISLHLDLADDS